MSTWPPQGTEGPVLMGKEVSSRSSTLIFLFLPNPTCMMMRTAIRVRDTTPVILMTGYAVSEYLDWLPLFKKGASTDQMSWLDHKCAIR